jgi:FtsP/CotA-like multicopper oxidase with cupredoxin domain
VARRHLRFALKQVTFAGLSMPGATLDCWDDDNGRSQWSARVVTRSNPEADEGEFVGVMADGRVVTGHVTVGGRQIGPGGRRETLVEFHGSGDLHGLEEPPA